MDIVKQSWNLLNFPTSCMMTKSADTIARQTKSADTIDQPGVTVLMWLLLLLLLLLLLSRLPLSHYQRRNLLVSKQQAGWWGNNTCEDDVDGSFGCDAVHFLLLPLCNLLRDLLKVHIGVTSGPSCHLAVPQHHALRITSKANIKPTYPTFSMTAPVKQVSMLSSYAHKSWDFDEAGRPCVSRASLYLYRLQWVTTATDGSKKHRIYGDMKVWRLLWRSEI